MFEVLSQHCWCEEVTTISALGVSNSFMDLNDQIRMTTVSRWEIFGGNKSIHTENKTKHSME